MRIVCLSDTHSFGDRIAVPDGDVIVHAGDLTMRGTEDETRAALAWLDALPHRTKLVVPGNHDFFFDDDAPDQFHGWRLRPRANVETVLAEFPSIALLRDAACVVDGVNFYGSPWQPWFGGWAFNFPRSDDDAKARAIWSDVPDATQVLVTHGPPFGIRDRVARGGAHVGDRALRARIATLSRLRVHAFGHIHEGYGIQEIERVRYVNASICTLEYAPINPPIVIDLEE